MDPSITKADFAAFTADFKTNGGTVTAIATKADANGNPWLLEAIAPEFGEDGKLVKPAGVVVKDAPQAGGKGVLKVALVTNDGKEATSSLVVDVAPNYLAFQAVEDGALVSIRKYGSLEAPSLEYSNDLVEWTEFDFRTQPTIELAKAGDKVYFRNADDGVAAGFSLSSHGYYAFNMSGSIAASGNIMSLIDKSCASTTIPCANCFYGLFENCTSLTSAPELPATTLAEYCYTAMFSGCTKLVTAPTLPATTLSESCYHSMFEGCTKLAAAPELPATTLTENCYGGMFYGCTSLATAPTLPATTLAEACYDCMFYGCTSLETAPALPATILAVNGYNSMFFGCTNLTTAPALPATTLANGCYNAMFRNCSKLNKVEVGFTDWGENNTSNWLNGVAATGDFICPDELSKKYGASYIPENWAVNGTFPYLNFKANAPSSRVQLNMVGGESTGLALEYSTDECQTWAPYTITYDADKAKVADYEAAFKKIGRNITVKEEPKDAKK